MSVHRDCKSCEFYITKWIGRACAWCESDVINIYQKKEYKLYDK